MSTTSSPASGGSSCVAIWSWFTSLAILRPMEAPATGRLGHLADPRRCFSADGIFIYERVAQDAGKAAPPNRKEETHGRADLSVRRFAEPPCSLLPGRQRHRDRAVSLRRQEWHGR